MARFPAIEASQTSYMQVKHRVFEAQFANGFRQMLGHAGAYRRTWHVKFLDKPVGDIERIDAFLHSLAGSTPFFWQPPNNGSNNDEAQFICTEWKITPVNAVLASLDTIFIQV